VPGLRDIVELFPNILRTALVEQGGIFHGGFLTLVHFIHNLLARGTAGAGALSNRVPVSFAFPADRNCGTWGA
jgi:hypothetical protein